MERQGLWEQVRRLQVRMGLEWSWEPAGAGAGQVGGEVGAELLERVWLWVMVRFGMWPWV